METTGPLTIEELMLISRFRTLDPKERENVLNVATRTPEPVSPLQALSIAVTAQLAIIGDLPASAVYGDGGHGFVSVAQTVEAALKDALPLVDLKDMLEFAPSWFQKP